MAHCCPDGEDFCVHDGENGACRDKDEMHKCCSDSEPYCEEAKECKSESECC